MRVDDLGFVQVALHELVLDEARRGVNIAVGTWEEAEGELGHTDCALVVCTLHVQFRQNVEC